MNVKVSYFGPARDWAGVECDTFEIQAGLGVGGLMDMVMEKHPEMAKARDSLRMAVNEEFVGADAELCDGDEVAVIPPVSGGADDDLVAIVSGPIDAGEVREHVCGDPAFGGVATFEGVTRLERDAEHGDLVRLEYEAYRGMAVKQMRKLAAEARSRWPVGRLAVVHRVGEVPCGEASVVIAVACGHRDEAFEACRWLIDTLKTEVPIWKREVWRDGASSWVDPTNEKSKSA